MTVGLSMVIVFLLLGLTVQAIQGVLQAINILSHNKERFIVRPTTFYQLSRSCFRKLYYD